MEHTSISPVTPQITQMSAPSNQAAAQARAAATAQAAVHGGSGGAAGDGDGDHGVEPGGGGTGQLVNLRG